LSVVPFLIPPFSLIRCPFLVNLLSTDRFAFRACVHPQERKAEILRGTRVGPDLFTPPWTLAPPQRKWGFSGSSVFITIRLSSTPYRLPLIFFRSPFMIFSMFHLLSRLSPLFSEYSLFRLTSSSWREVAPFLSYALFLRFPVI